MEEEERGEEEKEEEKEKAMMKRSKFSSSIYPLQMIAKLKCEK